jgi:hypothetical protein
MHFHHIFFFSFLCFFFYINTTNNKNSKLNKKNYIKQFENYKITPQNSITVLGSPSGTAMNSGGASSHAPPLLAGKRVGLAQLPFLFPSLPVVTPTATCKRTKTQQTVGFNPF